MNLFGTALQEYWPLVFFVRTLLQCVYTVKTSEQYFPSMDLMLG